jgi:multidrug efflux pump
MMCARLLKHKPESEQGAVYRFSERVFQGIIAFYGRTLQIALRFQPLTLLVAIGTLVATVWLFIIIPKGFFPVQDTGVILGISEAPQMISFAAMAERQQALGRMILEDPAVESLSSFIGVDGTNTTINSGRIQINLKPLEERGIDASDIIRRLGPKLATIDGIQLFMQPVQDLTVEDRVSRTQYQYSLEDPDSKELDEWAPRFISKLQSIPELRDVASDRQSGGLQAALAIDRNTASRFGITPTMIDDTLYDAYGKRQITTMYTQLNQYRVVLEIKPDLKRGPDDLKNIYVRSTQGGEVPLDAFSHFEESTAPLAINHQGQFQVVTASFNLAPGKSLGDAVAAINHAKEDLGLPASIAGSFQGTAAAFQASLANEPILILAAMVTVYIVLGVLYESYIHPLTILSTLPSAGVGALLALMITHNDFSVIALIGIVLLIGIVEKNAIMMIDFALEAERKEGLDPANAIYQAALLRFRPIVMTTLAAMFGGLPLALGTGTGAELRRPLGIAIVGGLIFSQLLTLYTTPVVYLTFDRIAKRLSRRAPVADVEPLAT